MRLELDHDSPIPLYHQLAESLRYRIATGAIPPGALLPPVRTAATDWGVNLHTVRRAYAELGKQGIVATRAAQGTRVLPRTGPALTGRVSARDRFFSRVLREAKERHGLGAHELAACLTARKPGSPPSPAVAYVVECSQTQCEDLAAQMEARWRLTALPWPLDREEPPPPGVVISTYFHYNDVRLRWPARFSEVRFAAIRPDPRLKAKMQAAGGAAKRKTLFLCERDRLMARNIGADLSRILPAEEFDLQIKVLSQPESWLARRKGREPVLFAPRMWGGLSKTARSDPRVHEVRYVFDSDDLESVGRDLGWAPRS